ncbi:MAG: hypothetical protein HKK67_06380 [Chlorobiaceae bacterium]|nr:hypothetical protein [Chlorobiaceae bacterium]
MAKVKKEEPAITVNGKKYLVADLAEEAKTQLVNIQAADAEINRLQVQLAIAQTARNAYQQALIAALPSQV